MARSSLRYGLLLVFAPPATPILAAADQIYRYGYRTERHWVLTPARAICAVPSITSTPSAG
jgi:hypothetical protein